MRRFHLKVIGGSGGHRRGRGRGREGVSWLSNCHVLTICLTMFKMFCYARLEV